jgi:hypothetical protein
MVNSKHKVNPGGFTPAGLQTSLHRWHLKQMALVAVLANLQSHLAKFISHDIHGFGKFLATLLMRTMGFCFIIPTISSLLERLTSSNALFMVGVSFAVGAGWWGNGFA